MSGEDKCWEDDESRGRDRECGGKGVLFYVGWSGNTVNKNQKAVQEAKPCKQ